MSGENGRDKGEWWYFQFDPSAWHRDPGVQGLNLEERGAWLELLLRMHESPQRGRLLHDSGNPMSDDWIARILKIPLERWMAIRSILVGAGIAGVDEGSGALFNRKMLRDTEKRGREIEAKREGGRKGAEKRWHSDSSSMTGAWDTMGINSNRQNKSNPISSPALDGPEANGKTPQEGTPETFGSTEDPLKSVNYRGALCLLLSVKISEKIAKSLAGQYPLGRIAEVVEAAELQKKPSGFAIAALEGNYVVPALSELARDKILKSIEKLPKLEIPASRSRGPIVERKAGETDDAYFVRTNEAIKKQKEDGSKGPRKV